MTNMTNDVQAFLQATYPHFAGTKYDVALGGPLPSVKNFTDAASIFGVRLGSKQAFALAMTLRDGGSTAAQRTYAGQGKTQNNIGGCQDLLRAQHKTAKLVAGQTYKLSFANGAVCHAVSNKAGHIAVTVVTGPTVAAAPKVQAKVAANAADKADKADKPKASK